MFTVYPSSNIYLPNLTELPSMTQSYLSLTGSRYNFPNHLEAKYSLKDRQPFPLLENQRELNLALSIYQFSNSA
jgi:hypothetical protein